MLGERKLNFADEINLLFNLLQNTSSDDLIREISAHAGDQMSLLPLSNEIFTNQDLKITYWSGTTIETPIGKQFDTLIFYPEISVLTSMDT